MARYSQFDPPPEGRQPRKGNQLRGLVGRLADANHDRNEAARLQHEITRRRNALWSALMRFVFVTPEELERMAAHSEQGDITVGHLVDLVARRQTRRCVPCQYDLRGLASQGWCPECGAPFRFAYNTLVTWEDLAAAIAEPLAMKPADITQNLWVFRRIHEVSVQLANQPTLVVEDEVELEELE